MISKRIPITTTSKMTRVGGHKDGEHHIKSEASDINQDPDCEYDHEHCDLDYKEDHNHHNNNEAEARNRRP